MGSVLAGYSPDAWDASWAECGWIFLHNFECLAIMPEAERWSTSGFTITEMGWL